MKCPACPNSLSQMTAGDVTVDVCRGGCGGVWFDDKEILKFDEKHELDGENIISVEKKANLRPTKAAPRNCPKCEGQVLCRRFYDVKNEVEVDQCLKCSGIWLDIGELNAIRQQYESEKDRYSAADNYLSSHLASAKAHIADGYSGRLKHWDEDTKFRGVLRQLFAGFLRENQLD